MAWGKRLYSKWFSADGLAYQAWLEQDSYAAGTTQFSVQEDPAVIDRGRQDVDFFSPVRGTSAKLAVWIKTDGELDVLLDAATHEWRLRIVSGASHAAIDAATYDTVWIGYLILDNYQDDTVHLPSQLELEAIDGLSELDKVPYTDDSGSPEVAYTGREDFFTVAKRCLDEIGYSLPIRTACRIYPDGVAATVDPWVNLELDNAIFYDTEGNARSCLGVLRQLCYATGSILVQEDGLWKFIQVDLLDGTDYDVYDYDTSGSADGTDTDGAAIDLDAALAAETAFREGGKRSFFQPVGLTLAHFAHGLVPSLIHAGSFDGVVNRGGRGVVDAGEDPDDYWTFVGSGGDAPVVRDSSGARYYERQNFGGRGEIGRGQRYLTGDGVAFIPAFAHGSSRDLDTIKAAVVTDNRNVYQSGETVEAGQRIVFSGKIRIPKNSGDGTRRYQAYWRLEITGSHQCLEADGSWTDETGNPTEDRLRYIVNPGDEWGDGGLAMDTEYTFRFVSEAAPDTGAVFLQLWGTSDRTSGTPDPEGVEWDDISVDLVDDDGTALEATDAQVWTGLPDQARPGIELLMGSGPTEFMASRLTWAGTYYTDFVSDNLATGQTHARLLAETWLRMLNRFVERRMETYRGASLRYSAAVTLGGDNYVLMFQSWSIRHNRHTVELVKAEFDAATSVTKADGVAADSIIAESSAGTPAAYSGAVTALDNLAGFISTQNPIALLDEDLAAGDTITSFDVDSMTDGGLLDDDLIIVVDRITAEPTVFAMSADEASTTWSVDDPDNPGTGLTLSNDIASGSGVYFSNARVLSLLRTIGSSPITTKGDLIVGDASGDDARLAAGADYRFLIALAAATNGVQWSTYSAPSSVFSGTFIDNDGNTVTVVNGWITSQVAPGLAVAYIYYLTAPGTDGAIRRMTPAGTDSEVVSSIETLTGEDHDVNAALAFLQETQEIVLANDDTSTTRKVFAIPLDGSTYREVCLDGQGSEVGTIYSLAKDDADTNLFIGTDGEMVAKNHLGIDYSEDLTTVGGDTVLAMAHNVADSEVYYCNDAHTDGIQKVTLAGSTGTVVASLDVRALAYDANNELIWAWDHGNGLLKAFDTSGTLQATIDLPGTYTGFEIVSMAYDAENDVLYMARSDDDTIWTIPGSTSSTAADAAEVGTCGDSVAGQIVLVHEGGAVLPDTGDITDCVFWGDAGDALDAGAATPDDAEAVATWPDQSGNGNDMAVAGPVYVLSDADLNNQPSILFDGSNDYATWPDGTIYPSGSTVVTVIMVMASDPSSDGYFAYLGAYTAGFGLRDGGGSLDLYDGTSTKNGADFTQNAAQVVSYVMDQDIFRLFTRSHTDGTWEKDSVTSVTAAESDSPQVLGARADGSLPTISLPWEGQIAAIRAYSRRLTLAEVTAIVEELNTTYGL